MKVILFHAILKICQSDWWWSDIDGTAIEAVHRLLVELGVPRPAGAIGELTAAMSGKEEA